jgi:hypothetical protein
MQTLKKLLDLLTPDERKRAGLLFGMILVMALLDTLGVASIMPFMAVLANPELVETNAILNTACAASGNLSHEITIILIAHRLSTVKECDTVFLLEKGELKAQGRFEELETTNHMFKKMTGTVA